MKCRSKCVPSFGLFQRLESRLLFATTYNFGSLTGYVDSGHSWKYKSSYKIADLGNSKSGSGTESVSVTKQGTTTPAKLKVAASGGGANQSFIVQTDSKGLNLLELDTVFGSDTIKLALTGTELAPTSMVVNKSYADTGTFSGAFSGSVGGYNLSGKVTGTTSTTNKITGTAAVKTPAGNFTAVVGTYTVHLIGTIKSTIMGLPTNVNFSESLLEPYWAVNGVGIVKSQATLSTTVAAIGKTATLGSLITSNLTSYSPAPPKTVKPATASVDRSLIDLLDA